MSDSEKKNKPQPIINKNGLISYDGTRISFFSEGKDIRFDPIDPEYRIKVYEKDPQNKLEQRNPTADEALDFLLATQENYPEYIFMEHLGQICTLFVEAEDRNTKEQMTKRQLLLQILTERNHE